MATRLALVVLASVLGLGGPARAHIVFGTPSLHELVRSADLVVRVRIAGHHVIHVPDARVQRPTVDAVVLETLHGEPVRRVTFVPHGHGAAEYHDGEEALVFLKRLDRVPELAATPLAGRIAWVSLQETTDKIPLGPRTRAAWTSAARRYIAVDGLADSSKRREALREMTIALLGSAEPRLAASALRDVVAAGDLMPFTAADVPRLESLIERPTLPITVRVGVLAELERRGLVAGPTRWARLLHEARGPDLVVVARAVAAHPSPEVTQALLRVVDGSDRNAAAAAAVSLGSPGNQAAVVPLTHLLAGDDERLRSAAIRALGRIGGTEALDALAQTAAFHPDAATRRRARAEAAIMSGRLASTR